MGEIRFLGRARGGRCVYCHDSLSGDVRTCPECSATWHPDCGQMSTRCSTVGCSGPAPGGASRPGRTRARVRPEVASVASAHGLDPDRPRPGILARVGPYTRLVASSLLSASIATLATLFLLWPATRWSSYWKMCLQGEDGAVHSEPVAAAKGLAFVAVAIWGLFSACRSLLRVPAVLNEVRTLLAATRPTAMRLTVEGVSDGESGTDWFATLVGDGTTLSITLSGLLPPFWLRRSYVDEPVLVYGLPPPGPYVIEFRDGWLALVHPD